MNIINKANQVTIFRREFSKDRMNFTPKNKINNARLLEPKRDPS